MILLLMVLLYVGLKVAWFVAVLILKFIVWVIAIVVAAIERWADNQMERSRCDEEADRTEAQDFYSDRR